MALPPERPTKGGHLYDFAADNQPLPKQVAGSLTNAYGLPLVAKDTSGLARFPSVLSNTSKFLAQTTFCAGGMRNRKMFIGSTGSVTIAGAGNFRALITNPPGESPIALYKLSFYNSLNVGTTATVRVNPTTVITANTLVPVCARVASTDTPVLNLSMKYDTNLTTAISGGRTYITLPVAAGIGVLEAPFPAPVVILNPGVSIGVNVVFGGAATLSVTGYFMQLDPTT